MRVDYAPVSIAGFYDRANVDATFPAKKKVRRPESEAVSLQLARIVCAEANESVGIGRAQCIVRAAKRTLAGADGPVRWREPG